MAENKTQENDGSVDAFIQSVDDETKMQDSRTIIELMRQVTQHEPMMWGESIVGFDRYHYKYATGREGDSFKVGFSPRKQNMTVYLSYGFENNEDLMERLGKYKIGKACLYFKRLSDIDMDVLRELVARTYRQFD